MADILEAEEIIILLKTNKHTYMLALVLELLCNTLFVAFFDQRLGALHSKCWSKSAFSMFFVQKNRNRKKSKKFDAKFSKNMGVFG